MSMYAPDPPTNEPNHTPMPSGCPCQWCTGEPLPDRPSATKWKSFNYDRQDDITGTTADPIWLEAHEKYIAASGLTCSVIDCPAHGFADFADVPDF